MYLVILFYSLAETEDNKRAILDAFCEAQLLKTKCEVVIQVR